jgi:hypothetical protein
MAFLLVLHGQLELTEFVMEVAYNQPEVLQMSWDKFDPTGYDMVSKGSLVVYGQRGHKVPS